MRRMRYLAYLAAVVVGLAAIHGHMMASGHILSATKFLY